MAKVQFGFARANSLTNRQAASLLFIGMMMWGAGTLGHGYVHGAHYVSRSSHNNSNVIVADFEAEDEGAVEQVASAAVDAAADAAAEVEALSDHVSKQIAAATPEVATRAVEAVSEALQPEPKPAFRQAELSSGQTFSDLLTKAAVPGSEAKAAMDALASVYDMRKLKAGQEFNLHFTQVGTDENLEDVQFQPELTREVRVFRTADGGFKAEAKDIPLERKRYAVRAEIDSSLYKAGAREGVPKNIMANLVRVYSHAVDFQRDIHPGDKFEVLYDQPTARNGTPVGDGTIIYAALEVHGEVKPLYRVTFGNGAVEYFDDKGQSLKRSILRTPIDGARITSGFGMRRHPILGYSRMHKGVDFGAPRGTPIYAAGDGVVEVAKYNGSYGRYIRIRHSGRVKTAYAHMNRFARNIKSGTRVHQGDVIGFVGTTGRSTGPHLHFEVLINNKQVNPMTVDLPRGKVLEGKELKEFRSGEAQIRAEFSDLLAKRLGARASVDPSAVDSDLTKPLGSETKVAQVSDSDNNSEKRKIR